ncbi:hypothetical protein GYMLUDRAFT_241327 [Collybiopsis luxurians FD-317 M1]|uniref:F-box domain-containing protein n=1 Tax=Collybiopsis luxurians FD-317 M1 TaxID=944289 RepID=A0A0D0C7G6_9AGAR|nr:hypothetical protein GYMLUDRAFT_241327 [Collybiopsis luxurians FD-317 M1]
MSDSSLTQPTLSTLLASESLSSLLLSSQILQTADLASLALVCKGFRLAATPFLYSRIVLHSQAAANKILRTIIHRPEFGSFINTLSFAALRNQPRFHHSVSREISLTLATVLPSLHNLEYLNVSEIWGFSAAIFQHAEQISCKLKICRLNRIIFSSLGRIVEFTHFLAKQDELKLLRLQVEALPEDYYDAQILHGIDAMENDDLSRLPIHCLPSLSTFDGSAFAATKLLQARAPLRHLRVHTALELDRGYARDNGPPPELFAVIDVRSLCSAISRSGIGKTLKTFSIFGCPGDEDLLEIVFTKDSQIRDVGDICGELIQTLAINCPQLGHVGALPLSCKDRSSIHEALMEMHSLRSIEFSVIPWAAQGAFAHPSLGLQQNSFPTPAALKAISMEMKMYCPSLKYFVYTYRYPQPPPRYPRYDRVVWTCSTSKQQNETGKPTGWETEWIMGDVRANWEDLWNMY